MDEQWPGNLESLKIRFEKLSEKNPKDIEDAISLLDSIWQTAGGDLKSQFPALYPDVIHSDGLEYNKNYWVAKNEKTGEVLGITGFSEFSGDLPQHAWLGWFAVKPGLQGSRIGVKMLHHTIEELKKLGKTDLYVQTSDRPNMKGNSKFYERNGFSVVVQLDTSNTIHSTPESGNLSFEIIRAVINPDDPANGITNFIRRRRLSEM